PLMQHHVNAAQAALIHLETELVLVQVVGDLAAHQVAELVTFGQIIHRQNVGVATPVQAANQIAADEAGSTGHYDHDSSPAVTTEVPSLPTTIPPARLAQ